MADDLLKLDGFCADYGKGDIVRDVSFALEAGTLTALLGPNGSGKSTLLRGLAGRIETAGRAQLAGKNLLKMRARRRERMVSYLPQHCDVTFSVPVREVVYMGFRPSMHALSRPNRAMRAEAERALAFFGLEGRADDDFIDLSGGQRQRVLLARVMVRHAPLALLDEPDTALDPEGRALVLARIREMVREGRAAGLICMHDINYAVRACDRIIVMTHGRVTGDLCLDDASPDDLQAVLESAYGPLALERRGGRYFITPAQRE